MSLLKDFAPIVHYDSHELYGAVAVESMVENRYDGGPGAAYANALRRTDGTLIASVDGDPPLTLRFLNGDRYPNDELVVPGDYLDAGNPAYSADARSWWLNNGDVVYGRDVPPRGDGRRWLQYWFFYYFNSKQLHRLGLHEGDWEMIQVGLAGNDEPNVVTYSQHGRPVRAEWKHVEENGRPAVYVALGSHASLPSAGRHPAPVIDDYCDGNGITTIPSLIEISDADPSWVAWPGRWGASRKKGVLSFPSPDAPITQRAWREPDEFHDSGRPWAPRPVTEMTLGFARPPTVIVSGTGNSRSVEFEVHGSEDLAWVAQLTISATLSGDQAPREYIFDVTTPGEQEPEAATESLDGAGFGSGPTE